MPNRNVLPKEGDIYKVVKIDGHVFELRFGFYEEFEREKGEPVVVYPDLVAEKRYTADGKRLVTAIQDPCPHYQVPENRKEDGCCNDCLHYRISGDEIGYCNHPEMVKGE